MILSLVKHWEKVMANEIEKARVSAIHRQLLLIPRKPADLCNDIGLNWSMALKLHENEWLSFDPKTVKELDESQETELLFVGSLIVGGCDEDLLTYLLTGLGKPYSYRVERIYYDWGAKTWKLIPTMPDLEEIFENREQIEIAKFYEHLPKPTLISIHEFLNDQIYFRDPHEEMNEESKPA